MSTRANIVVTDSYGDTLWFYRHSDGYPEGTMPTLDEFMKRVVTGELRSNASQAAGWLIIIGHEEYQEVRDKYPSINGWKVGAYEPTTGQHGDIEFLYTIDLKDKTIEMHNISSGEKQLLEYK